ncbi:hypothetical protein AKJ56_01495 [candidate division MSBL1 archaeon SCGC-AAA382N08]|uniref:Putative 3-methyladenine DNA glycosylase n=1 Tax=candidate division MSBL1 archaeon SCGC-AAA382N08 TaxID=1698285 RepID=A0A133VPJ6_9EURY|nr:hypothetical protein AKJ56_01495 [candidate division MSBL1 archaeon SCGC-AAA382N08]
MKLSRSFYERGTVKVARQLLGKTLTRINQSERLKGKIVETEAYLGPDDPASRASENKTKINELMWEKGGLTIIYMVHGNWLFNITAEKKGVPGSVLIRAVEPLTNLEIMKKRRGREKLRELTSGPGKLTQAFGITKKAHGIDLVSSEKIYVSNSEKSNGDSDIESSHRVGVNEDLQKKLRFYLSKNKYVS